MGLLASNVAVAQWQPDVRLTFDSSFSTTSFNGARSVAASDNSVYVIWSDARDGNREIYFKASPDDGISWDNDRRLTNNNAASIIPSIAVSGSIVHVIWEEYRDGNGEIYYKRSPDGGISWGEDTRLTNNPANSFSPSVVAAGNIVHLTWFDQRDGNNEVYDKRSSDGGLTWGVDARLKSDPSSSVFPAIAVSDTLVHVTWEEHRDGNGEVYYKRSSDGGITWGPDTRLTNDPANSFSPSIAASGPDVNIAWFDERDGNLEIYDKHSSDGGVGWRVDTRVTTNPSVSNYPSVSVSGSRIHTAWFDERAGNTEIFYNLSTNRGETWGTDVRLTNDAARSTDPSVAVSGSTVHVMCTDARDNTPTYSGNYEIYYKRNPMGNPLSVQYQGNMQKQLFALYPNPATKQVNVSVPGSAEYEVDIVNILGQQIAGMRNQEKIDVSGFARGVYFLRLRTNDRLFIQKFMKQ